MWTFHVAFGRSGAWIEILEDQVLRQIRTPFEEPTPDSLEESGDFGTAKGLVHEFDCICSRSH